jgi:hypothetical protein
MRAVAHADDEHLREAFSSLWRVIDGYLDDADVDYTVQMFNCIAELYYMVRHSRKAQMCIWDWIREKCSFCFTEELHFALSYIFLYPLVEEPRDDFDMREALKLAVNPAHRDILLDAYAHLDDPGIFDRDLEKYGNCA